VLPIMKGCYFKSRPDELTQEESDVPAYLGTLLFGDEGCTSVLKRRCDIVH
jgi:hypothetical protein